MKKLLFLLAAGVLMMACGQDKAVVKQLDDKAVEIHDAVMPKMGDIITLKGELRAKLESLDSTQLMAQDAHLKVLASLEVAEQGMKDWMHGYVVPDYKKPLEELKPLVEEQLAAIQAVERQMEESITNAKGLLEK